MWRPWRRRRHPDPAKLGNLTLWETVNEDGQELDMWAEMSTDPAAAEHVVRVKAVFRDLGWTQTAGD